VHQVLNAKYHEMEAQIVAQAGRYKGVTIATNMAGRGTDILLGGNPSFIARTIVRQKFAPADPNYQEEYNKLLEKYKKETAQEHDKVVALGGLHVLGTERHEARRVDNQLRGRCGRQGDPGSSRFYVSLEDDLMRLFGSDRLVNIMNSFGLEEGQVIEHPWVSKSIEVAQRRVEQHNFEIRKQLLDYDNVMNKQREVIYSQRREILEGISLKDSIIEIIEKIVDDLTGLYTNEHITASEWDIPGLINAVKLKFGIEIAGVNDSGRAALRDDLKDKVIRFYEEKEKNIGTELERHMERMIFMQIIDAKWKDHLYAMDSLREGIGLRAYGQRDPLVEYKREAFDMFSQMMNGIDEEAIEMIFKLQPAKQERFKGVFSELAQEMMHPEVSKFQPSQEGDRGQNPDINPAREQSQPSKKMQPKVGRNDPCPCGSGNKYKKCCGK